MVLHVPTFFSELETLESKGISIPAVGSHRLNVSSRCALNLDLHAVADRMREGNLGANSIGTTGRGIGPAYSTKAERSGLVVADLFEDDKVLEDKMRNLAKGYEQSFGGQLVGYNVEDEIAMLKVRLPSDGGSLCLR